MNFLTILAFFLVCCLFLLLVYVGVTFHYRWFSRRHPELQTLAKPIKDGGAMSSVSDSFQNIELIGFKKGNIIALGITIALVIVLLILVQYNIFGIADWLAG